jgi:hypothetical protein
MMDQPLGTRDIRSGSAWAGTDDGAGARFPGDAAALFPPAFSETADRDPGAEESVVHKTVLPASNARRGGRCAMINLVPSDTVESLWPTIEGLVRRGLAQSAGMVAEDELRAELSTGRLQLWWDAQAPMVAVTMIAEHPGLRVLCVVLLAGERMSGWLRALETALESFGRAHGCKALEALVRPGMAGARYNRQRAALGGWRAEKTLMRRPIVS